ncbi:GNAT family protein [Streptomyces sp. NPDC088354]|uniref:GNAT family N-acetyltransferase n=1 Tax=unclassified Streptomyces TaxID=2593676 RepID=UPI0029AE6C00|nr:GNAT family protein [Streptomyces sp. MI02-7b]MDX3076900.1 GNAT family protein [Streptomyces sp. MI02-7b]
MAVRFPASVTIDGRYARLVPLSRSHVPDLYQAARGDEQVWRWLSTTPPRSAAEMGAIVDQRLAQAAAGEAVAFSVVPRATDRPSGWAAYIRIAAADERVDIGWSWLDPTLWGTPVHLETHFMLVYYAFEDLGFGRVQWRLDDLDLPTQDAVSRIGGIREGVLRRHLRRVDGTWRDTVYYSLVAAEWPAVKERWMSGWILE